MRYEQTEAEAIAGHTGDIGIDNPVVFSLSYGGHFYECAAVFFSASVLVSKFQGRAFETEGGTFMSSEELFEAGQQCFQMAKGQ